MKEDKDVKLTIVAFTNAIVNPWAVMVVAIYTLLAEDTVSTPGRTDYFTVWTKTASFKRVKQFDEVEIWVLLYDPWVTPPNDNAKEDCSAKQPLR